MVRVTGARFGCNMISAVSPKGQLRFMVVEGKVAGRQFCEFIRRLVYNASRPIFLILDGHPVHRSAQVRRLVESLDGKIELFFVPPCSPNLIRTSTCGTTSRTTESGAWPLRVRQT